MVSPNDLQGHEMCHPLVSRHFEKGGSNYMAPFKCMYCPKNGFPIAGTPLDLPLNANKTIIKENDVNYDWSTISKPTPYGKL